MKELFAKYICCYDRKNKTSALSTGKKLDDLSEIESCLKSMNGESRCEFFIGESFPDEDHAMFGGIGMTITGGCDNLFRCQIYSERNGEQFEVFDSAKNGRKKPMMVNEVEVPFGSLTNLKETLSIANHFAEKGDRHPDFKWAKL